MPRRGAAVAVVAVVIGHRRRAVGVRRQEVVGAADARDRARRWPAAGDQNTGFDLYVNPPGVTTWRLDGEARTDRLPSRIRGISPGPHQVSIDAPPGFMSQNQHVTVEAGKAPKVEIALQPIADITGQFDSTPPGANVTLIVDGKRQPLGVTPATSKLDPHFGYLVLFEKPGYVSINKPIAFGGTASEKINVNLEKAGDSRHAGDARHDADAWHDDHATGARRRSITGDHAAHPTHGPTPTPTPTPTPVHVADNHPVTTPTPTPTPGHVDPPVAEPRPPSTPIPRCRSRRTGTLALGSKPPCEIFVDGADTSHPRRSATAGRRARTRSRSSTTSSASARPSPSRSSPTPSTAS